MIVKGQLSNCSLVRLLNQNDVIFQKFNGFGFLGRGYRLYSNKRRRAYLIFFTPQVWRLFEGGAYLNIVTDKFTFSIFLCNGTLSIC